MSYISAAYFCIVLRYPGACAAANLQSILLALQRTYSARCLLAFRNLLSLEDMATRRQALPVFSQIVNAGETTVQKQRGCIPADVQHTPHNPG